jgi:hypothetical protein
MVVVGSHAVKPHDVCSDHALGGDEVDAFKAFSRHDTSLARLDDAMSQKLCEDGLVLAHAKERVRFETQCADVRLTREATSVGLVRAIVGGDATIAASDLEVARAAVRARTAAHGVVRVGERDGTLASSRPVAHEQEDLHRETSAAIAASTARTYGQSEAHFSPAVTSAQHSGQQPKMLALRRFTRNSSATARCAVRSLLSDMTALSRQAFPLPNVDDPCISL